jgi:hypothetical protein
LDVVVVLGHVGCEASQVGAGSGLDVGINGVHWAVQVEDAFCCHLAPIDVDALDEGDFLCGLLEYQAEHWMLHDGNFDVRFLGDDYIDKPFTGDDLDIPIHYLNRDHGWSTTKYKQLIANSLNEK